MFSYMIPISMWVVFQTGISCMVAFLLTKGFAECIAELVSTVCLSLLGGPAKRESSFHMSAFTLAFCLSKYYSAIFHPDLCVYMN